MPLRLLLLSTCCASLTSCGTASHYLGMAGGLVNSITSPVLGLIRLSDSPDLPARTPSTADPAHDAFAHGALGKRLDRFDQGVAGIDIDTGIVISG